MKKQTEETNENEVSFGERLMLISTMTDRNNAYMEQAYQFRKHAADVIDALDSKKKEEGCTIEQNVLASIAIQAVVVAQTMAERALFGE